MTRTTIEDRLHRVCAIMIGMTTIAAVVGVVTHRARPGVGKFPTEISPNGELAMKSISRSGHVIGKRFGLGRDAIFRLWKAAIKDDEGLLDEAIAATFDRM